MFIHLELKHFTLFLKNILCWWEQRDLSQLYSAYICSTLISITHDPLFSLLPRQGRLPIERIDSCLQRCDLTNGLITHFIHAGFAWNLLSCLYVRNAISFYTPAPSIACQQLAEAFRRASKRGILLEFCQSCDSRLVIMKQFSVNNPGLLWSCFTTLCDWSR